MTFGVPRKIKGKNKQGEVGWADWDLAAVDQANSSLKRAIEHTLSEYLAALDQNSVVEKALREMITIALDDDYGGAFAALEAPPSELAFRITLPIGKTQGEGPSWGFSLCEIVREEISDFQEGAFEDTKEAAEYLTIVRDALRALANEIDTALLKPEGGTL